MVEEGPGAASRTVFPSLKKQGASIRLLRFTRDKDGSFRGELRSFLLIKAPPFYTASYVWGSLVSSRYMQLESGRLPILDSLAAFLRLITQHKDFSRDDWWWFDSICINLDNARERGAQVGMMADIYQRAKRTCIWLGEEREEDSDCSGAMEFLKYLSSLTKSLIGQVELRPHMRKKKFAGQWKAVGELLGRPWWTRVWTLQEYILPEQAAIYCGQNGISRSALKSAVYSIYLVTNGYDDELFPMANYDSGWNRRRLLQWYNKYQEMGLISVIANLSNHAASDDRDRVYCALGLIGKRSRRLIGKPDYEKSVEQVYAGLVEKFYKEYHCLDIICFSHLFHRNEDGGLSGEDERILPSWAPDWRVWVHSSSVPLMASQSSSQQMIGNFRPLHEKHWTAMYHADGNGSRKRARVRFADNCKEMWADGIALGVIDGLSGADGYESRCTSTDCKARHNLVSSEQRSRLKISSIKVAEAIARSLTLDRSSKYLGHAAPEHYASDFTYLLRRAVGGEDVDPLFQTWYDQTNNIFIGGKTLAAIAAELGNERRKSAPPPIFAPPAPIRTPSDPVTQPRNQDTFLERFHDVLTKRSRRLFVTEQGHIGMAPCHARQGDVVAILFGCNIPLVLRSVGVREAFRVIGEAYVHGYMNGEIQQGLKHGALVPCTFELV